jgi:hypothetical protein
VHGAPIGGGGGSGEVTVAALARRAVVRTAPPRGRKAAAAGANAQLATLEPGDLVHVLPPVSRPFPSWNRSILTEIYLCHACSCQEILRAETAGQEASQAAPQGWLQVAPLALAADAEQRLDTWGQRQPGPSTTTEPRRQLCGWVATTGDEATLL